MSKFTPGPWFVTHSAGEVGVNPDGTTYDTRTFSIRVRDTGPAHDVPEGQTSEGLVANISVGCWDRFPKGESLEANVYLMAAAPELLRHLYILHQVIMRAEWRADTWEWLGDYMNGVVTKALSELDITLPKSNTDDQGYTGDDPDDDEGRSYEGYPVWRVSDKVLTEADVISERPKE